MNKKFLLLIILTIVFCIFIYLRYKSYSYKIQYNFNNFKIIESYNNESSNYTFLIKHQDHIYPFSIEEKYYQRNGLIENIIYSENKEESCVLPVSKKIKFFPICIKNNKIVSYENSSLKIKEFKYAKIKESIKKYKNINIYSDNNKNYLLYNYKDFYYYNCDNNKNINLFTRDNYNINISYQVNEYFLIADYNSNYYFQKFYLINMKNGKVEEIEFDEKISFNSIFLGDFKNKVYLLDKKEKKEYVINIKRKSVELIDFVILKNNKLEFTTFDEIINKNKVFDNKEKSSYSIIGNTLIQNIDEYEVIINDNVSEIIKEQGNDIYYISNDKLYLYSGLTGNVLLMQNNEWNFKNTNMVYIY